MNAKADRRITGRATSKIVKIYMATLIAAGTLSFTNQIHAGGHMNESPSERQPTVLITGSNRGIGLEFARQYSEAGWKVIATARKPESAEALQALAAGNENIIIEQLDVTDYARMESLANQYSDQPIDVLLSNAGITPRYKSAMGGIDGVDFEMARQSLEVNAIAVLKLAQVFKLASPRPVLPQAPTWLST